MLTGLVKYTQTHVMYISGIQAATISEMPGDNKRGVNKVIFYGLTQEVYPTLRDIFSVVRYMLSTKDSTSE